MSSAFQITFPGLQSTLNKMSQVKNEITRQVDAELRVGSEDIVKTARSLAPKNYGVLARSISFKKEGFLEYEIVAQSDYAAFMEFGTKGYVDIPPEAAQYAQQFKNQKKPGTYEQLVDSLTTWVKRKGLAGTSVNRIKSGKNKGKYRRNTLATGIAERNLARFIAFLILKNGVRPQPFFFPAIRQHRYKIASRIVQVVKNAGK